MLLLDLGRQAKFRVSVKCESGGSGEWRLLNRTVAVTASLANRACAAWGW